MSIQTPPEESEYYSQIELADAAHASGHQEIKVADEADKGYPKGLKLALIVVAILASMFLVALVRHSLSLVPLDSDSDCCRIGLLSQQLYHASAATSTL